MAPYIGLMETPYRLHYAPDNASLIIRIILEELGVPYDAVLVDRSTQAQNAPDFLRLNPLGMIPALATPHGTLFETAAIALWLTEEHGALLPAPHSPARGDALKWLFAISNGLHANLRKMFYPEKFIGSDQIRCQALRTGLAQQINTDLGHLETLALERTAIFGAATPSALDIYVAVCMRWTQLYPSDFDANWVSMDRFPALRTIATRLEMRPSVRAAIKAEGLGPTPFTSPRYATPPEGSAT